MKIAFVTDTGTGKSQKDYSEEDIFCLPLQISWDDNNKLDLEELSIDQSYELMRNGKLLKTSLPPVGLIIELFERLKAEGYERIFAVPICRGLSGTINAMEATAKDLSIPFDYVDCHVTAIVEDYMIRLAREMHHAGKSIDEIKVVMNQIVDHTNTLILPNDLNHLKRGGRLTASAALLGSLLKIKPILKINKETEGRIDVIDKVRTMSRAMDEAVERMKADNIDVTYMITVAHADDEAEGFVLQEKLKQAFPTAQHNMIKLVSVVGVHTGAGAQCIQYFKMIKG